MKLSDLFKKKDGKISKISSKELTVRIDRKQLEKITGGVEETLIPHVGPAHGKVEANYL